MANPEDFNNFTYGDCLCPANTTGGQCRPGYYCPAGSIEPIACEQGKYCETPGWCMNEFTLDTLLCIFIPGLHTWTGDCDAGFFCDRGAKVSNPTDGVTGGWCPEGRYCGKCMTHMRYKF